MTPRRTSALQCTGPLRFPMSTTRADRTAIRRATLSRPVALVIDVIGDPGGRRTSRRQRRPGVLTPPPRHRRRTLDRIREDRREIHARQLLTPAVCGMLHV